MESARLRRGISLIEVTVAAVVMSALVVMLGQAIGWVAVARRDSDLRQLALLEASNVLEQMTALHFEAVDAKRALETGLSDHASVLLGSDALRVDVQSSDEKPLAKRITVAVQYNEGNAAQGSVRLTAWLFQRGER